MKHVGLYAAVGSSSLKVDKASEVCDVCLALQRLISTVYYSWRKRPRSVSAELKGAKVIIVCFESFYTLLETKLPGVRPRFYTVLSQDASSQGSLL